MTARHRGPLFLVWGLFELFGPSRTRWIFVPIPPSDLITSLKTTACRQFAFDRHNRLGYRRSKWVQIKRGWEVKCSLPVLQDASCRLNACSSSIYILFRVISFQGIQESKFSIKIKHVIISAVCKAELMDPNRAMNGVLTLTLKRFQGAQQNCWGKDEDYRVCCSHPTHRQVQMAWYSVGTASYRQRN